MEESIFDASPSRKNYKDFNAFMADQPRRTTEAKKVRPRPSLEALFKGVEEARAALDEGLRASKGVSERTAKLQGERNSNARRISVVEAEKKTLLKSLKPGEASESLLKLNTELEILNHQLEEKECELRTTGEKTLGHEDLLRLRGHKATAEAHFYQAVLEELRRELPKSRIFQVALAAAVKANWAGNAGTILAELCRGYADPGAEHWERVRTETESAFNKEGKLW